MGIFIAEAPIFNVCSLLYGQDEKQGLMVPMLNKASKTIAIGSQYHRDHKEVGT